ncbi:DUF4192 family protein [Planomonospora corallina]|uniref:DUF4192 family protein n=1 Tax=Planomonospora corallina TaxID=1806052 RepID=A0ABV8IG56_9ACTN
MRSLRHSVPPGCRAVLRTADGCRRKGLPPRSARAPQDAASPADHPPRPSGGPVTSSPLAPHPLTGGSGPIRRLTGQVATRLTARLRAADPPVQALVTEGLERLHRAVAARRDGRALEDLTAVELGWDLQIIRIRDEAWVALHLDPDTMVGLLLEVGERPEEPLRAPLLSLLGYAAWHGGEHEAAHAALVGALRIDPAYSMAHLLHLALHSGVPAAAFTDVPTPAEIDREMGPARGTWLDPLRPLLARYAQPLN